jgi:hypothetical protein
MKSFPSQFKEQVIQHCENTPVTQSFTISSDNSSKFTVHLGQWNLEFAFGEDIAWRVAVILKTAAHPNRKCFHTDDLYPHLPLREQEWFAESDEPCITNEPLTTEELISTLIGDLVNASEPSEIFGSTNRKSPVIHTYSISWAPLSGKQSC